MPRLLPVFNGRLRRLVWAESVYCSLPPPMAAAIAATLLMALEVMLLRRDTRWVGCIVPNDIEWE